MISWLPMRKLLGAAAWVLPGFLLAGAALAGQVVPLVMGVVCGLTGKAAVLVSLGGAAGYLLFWGRDAMQPLFWLLAALPCGLLVGPRDITRRTPLLMVSISTLIVAAGGVLFQWLGDDTGVAMYLLRIALGSGATYLVQKAQARDTLAKWVLLGMLVLGLARIAPFPWLNFGCIAAGGICAVGAFPAAVLAGLALDLARFSRVSMTAAMCIGWFWQLLGRKPKPLRMAAPAISWVILAMLWGRMDLRAVPGLLLGGAVAMGCGKFITTGPRRGDTGVAQVRLEVASSVLQQTRLLLNQQQIYPVDEDGLLHRCAERACGGCACRKTCQDREKMRNLPRELLHRPLPEGKDLPVACRKQNRVLLELQRTQEQYRSIRADRQRQEEYRGALEQQYGFLSAFLQDLADQLPRGSPSRTARFIPRVEVFSNREREENGDRVAWFYANPCRFYVLLCDGMGTGLGAVDAGRTALGLLKQMLCAGFPGEHALGSLNSFCALAERGALVSVDMLEVELDTGKGVLYKWGAPPSFLVGRRGTEKIGTTVPPPGLSATGCRETEERLSLRRGETLLMVSDGVGGEEALRLLTAAPKLRPGELAAFVLEQGAEGCNDDATVASVYLTPSDLEAS